VSTPAWVYVLFWLELFVTGVFNMTNGVIMPLHSENAAVSQHCGVHEDFRC
jgi:hypothetical protein